MAETAQNKGDGIILIVSVGVRRPTLASGARSAMVPTVFRRARVIRPSDRSLGRLVAGAALIAALGLAGCGRKSGLDAPPSSLPGSPEPQASNSPSAPGLFGPNFGAPATTGAAPQNQTAQTTPPPQKKSFFLDWLVN
jgi:hypothetical protein